MQLFDRGGQLSSRPTPNASVDPGWANNDPTQTTQPTLGDPDWANAISAEFLTILTAAGLSMSKTNVAQLLSSMVLLFPGAVSSSLVSVNDGSTPNTKRNISVAVLPVSDGSANGTVLTNVSVSINSATSGAGGLDTGTLAASTVYYEWVIAQPGGASPTGLMSLSATAPTMPSGYTLKRRTGGSAITDASKNFYRITQKGALSQYIVTPTTNTAVMPLLANGAVGTWSYTTPTWATVSTAAFVPATAREIIVSVTNSYGGSGTSPGAVVPNGNYVGDETSGAIPPVTVGTVGGQDDAKIARFMLESANIYAAGGGSHFGLSVLGWVDSL